MARTGNVELRDKVIQAIRDGLSYRVIAKQLGLSYQMVGVIAKRYVPDLETIVKKTESKTIPTPRSLSLTDSELESVEEFVKDLRSVEAKIKPGQQLPSHERSRKRRELIVDLVRKGRSLRQVAKLVGVSVQLVYQYAKDAGVTASGNKPKQGSPMQDLMITRTGKPPLGIHGELVAEASSKSHQGPLQNRWHELSLYRTRGGKFVGAITFRTIWQGEKDRHTAKVADSPSELTAFFTEYDPTSEWEGYPDSPHYAEKQARLRTAISVAYGVAVSDLFDGVAELAERVE